MKGQVNPGQISIETIWTFLSEAEIRGVDNPFPLPQ